jgi:hypothetical protein
MAKLIAVLTGLLLLAAISIAMAQDATTKQTNIDWAQARQLLQKEQSGQQLTADEKAYLDKAKAEVRAGRGPDAAGRPGQGGPGNAAAPATQAKTGMIPLCDMTAKDSYKGEDAGLYGKGENTPPKEQMDAARKALARIQPLDKDGKPAADGKIVLISVGMSNTTNEFSVFTPMANKDPDKNPQLVIVDCAQGGQTAMRWAQPDAKVWDEAQQRLNKAGVSPKQVQVVWLKQAEAMPAKYGDFPRHAQQLKDNLVKDVQLVKEHYLNVQVVYLSSRIYAGYAITNLNPEPYAYEGAFAVRWLIGDQIKGSKDLNYDPQKGEVKAPVLLWGPYLWADGVAGRKSDKLVWTMEDFGSDGTHPSNSGREKVARLLLDFFTKDPSARGWFVKSGATAGTRPTGAGLVEEASC